MNVDIELSKFNNLIFTEENHKYRVNNSELISVTTFIGRNFKKPFPKDFLANKVAKRDNKTVKEVLYEWKIIADYGTDLGTKCHDYAEMAMTDKPATLYVDPNFVQRINLFNNFWTKYFQLDIKRWCEIQLYSEKLKIAGTFDLLFEKDDKLYLGDYKFNKDFKTEDHKYGKVKKLKEPFNKIWENDITIYSIQLSLYKYLIETETNLKIEDCYIFSFSTKDHYEIFKANDYTKELDYFFNKLHIDI